MQIGPESALFSFLMKATAPEGTKYVAGRRYEMIVFVRHISLEKARFVTRDVLAQLNWAFPEVIEAAQLDGKMKVGKLNSLNLEQAVRAAATAGHSIVVFE